MSEKRNIALIGFMGSGKTTVGKILASRLGYAFLDTDERICARSGMSVSEIFEKHGEAIFREMEKDAVARACALNGVVIATGGGAVKDAANVERLRACGAVVYLRATAERIFLNTRFDTGRPLLAAENRLEAIRELLKEREPLYDACRHNIVDVSALTPEDVADKILLLLGLHKA